MGAVGWSEIMGQAAPYVLGLLALVLASARNKTDDRKQELIIQGLFVQWSAELRDDLKQSQKELRALREIVQSQQTIIAKGRAEADRLIESLASQKEIHKERETRLQKDNEQLKTRLEAIMAENGELRTQVKNLREQVETLQKRVEDVEKRARENERALEVERAAREQVQRERDQLQRERDAIAMERDSLRVKVVELESALTRSNSLLEDIRKEVDQLKAKVKGQDDAAQIQ